MHARQGQAFPGVTPSFHLLNYQLSKQRIPVVCPLTFYRQRTSRTLPKWIAALALAARVGNQTVYQFQDVLFAMDIRQRIIVHRLFEIDCVEYLDAVTASLKQSAAFNEDAALRVGHNERAGIFVRHALHEIRFDEKSRLAAARAADNQYVFVAGIRRVLRAAAHCEPFRLRQNHVVGKHGIDKGLDILRRTP